MEVLILLILTSTYLLYCGYGLYLILTPTFLKRRELTVFLVLAWGLLLNLVVCTHAFFLDVPISRGLMLSGVFASLSMFWALSTKMPLFFRLPRQTLRFLKRYVWECLILLATLMIVVSPGIREGTITVPFRIGTDQTAYTETAQYLLQDGTRSALKSRLQKNTGTSNFADSMNAKERDLSFNTYIDADFLLQNRIGFQAITALLSKLTSTSHVYNIMFLNMIFSFFLLFGFSFYFLRKLGPRLFKRWAFWLAILILLNCNLLNVFYEGQYGQVFTVPFAVLATLIYFNFRRSSIELKSIFSIEKSKSILLASMVIAGILTSYSEYVVALMIVLALTHAIDLTLFRQNYWSALVGTLLSFLLALLLMAKFSFHWLHNVLFHYWVKNIPHAGFWQPHWAMPSEILGFSDIYLISGFQLIERSLIIQIMNIALSVLIGVVLLRYFWSARDRNKSFYLSTFLVVLMVFIKTYFITPTHNYQYYKSYTFLMPWIYFLFFGALAHSYQAILNKKDLNWVAASQGAIKALTVTLFVLAFATGLRYVKTFHAESEYVTRDMMHLKILNTSVDMNNYAVVTAKGRIAEYMLTPLFPFNWANQSRDKYLSPHLSKKVIMLVNKKDIRCPSCIIIDNRDDILYENGSFLLINSGLSLSEFLKPSPNTGNGRYPDFAPLFSRYKLNEQFL